MKKIIKAIVFSSAAFGFILIIYAFRIEPNRLVITRLTLPELAPLRFGLIADMQYKPRDASLMEKTVDTLNREKLDFVLVAGDWIEEKWELEGLIPHMKRIKAPLYGVMGNHDYWAYGKRHPNNHPMRRAVRQMGGHLLINESVNLGKGWVLVGLDDGWSGKPDPDLAFKGTEGKKRLLLLHEPEVAEMVDQTFSLAMGGHSHGGQVRLPGIGALRVPGSVGRYDMGLFRLPKGGKLFVTSGIGRAGMSTPRFLCPPEVAVISSR